jgi:hypothetical protein
VIRDLLADALCVTDDERQRQLAKIDKDLLDLELLEESIVRAGTRAGFKVRRRPDSDPRAVLAHDNDLPS